MAEVIVKENGVLHQFLESRAKLQVFGGGFGNGKTTGVVTKALQLGQDYPGLNALMARSTYPKLNDTLRKEFIKWTPEDWIESFPLSVNANNTCTLTNGSVYNFRYVAQQGKNNESTTSNLLSATYDLVVVDQLEDPEITHKDLLDLFGRLRGNTLYRGDDSSMPRSGPRWIMVTVNPTRNWVWKEYVEPLKIYQETGKITDKLFCVRDADTEEPILDEDGKPYLLIELFEAPTYENAHNLGSDFIQTLESSYKGQMKDRFLYGKWAAYEGLIYPAFDQMIHMAEPDAMRFYLESVYDEGYEVEWVEAYDYGLAVPSCYGLAAVDPNGFIHVVDGFYEKEMELSDQASRIDQIRRKWRINLKPIESWVNADPAIFKRTQGKQNEKISDVFWNDYKIKMQPADNSITHGIQKLTGYLNISMFRTHPYNMDSGSPMIFFSADMQYIADEFNGYMWAKRPDDSNDDKPREHQNDHAMDMVKYLLSKRPNASQIKPARLRKVPSWMTWQENSDSEMRKSRRYG